MRFSHVFIARPAQESQQLAALVLPLGVKPVLQPAFVFRAVEAASEQPVLVQQLEGSIEGPLLIFTSTRSVEFGLPQIAVDVLSRCRIAAIGPATSLALQAAGVQVDIRPTGGFTSEALLQTLKTNGVGLKSAGKSAFILAAPGGRRKMEESLTAIGWSVERLMVYRREQAPLDKKELEQLQSADRVLSVWTSANAMQSLSQRISPAHWFKICQGEWLVISDRLMRLSRAYGPAEIHQSSGPGNQDLFYAIKGLMSAD